MYVEMLDCLIDKFFENLGFDEVECFMDLDFAYYDTTKEVSYTLFELPLCDYGFKKYLMNTYPNIELCSMFTFSLLHELGHYVTWSGISRKNRLKSKKDKKRVERIKTYTDSDIINKQIAYCGVYEERIATREAVRILENNREVIKDFEKEFFDTLHKYYDILLKLPLDTKDRVCYT